METMVHFFIGHDPVCARVDPATHAEPGEMLPFKEVPIKLILRAKRRDESPEPTPRNTQKPRKTKGEKKPKETGELWGDI